MTPPLRICLALYRSLARAYPHEFRMIYGEDLDRLGEDAVSEVWRRYGFPGLLRLLADIAVRLPVEYFVELRQDVVYALRVWARSPGFAAAGVLSLAIGIGMCGVVLCGSNAMLGSPPGVRDPAEIVTPRAGVSYPYFERYRDQRQVAAGATAFIFSVPFAVEKERVYGHLVSPEYFSVLGVTPAAGRFFRPETEKPGMAPVLVVSDRFWRTHLNSDPQAVGRAVRVNGRPATIVGIGPKGFLGMWPWNPADVFVPVTCGASAGPELAEDIVHRRDLENFRMVLRLRHGVTIPAAEAALDGVTRGLDQETLNPERDRDRHGRELRLMPAGTMLPLEPEQRAFVVTFNVILWATVVALLCANLGNLLLARGAQRRREIAIRLSVGAGRARLVRQSLTESILLSLAGGLAGIACSYWIGHVMSSETMPSTTPVRMDFHPDLNVLAVTLAISLAAGVGFGLAPALSAVRTDIGRVLKEGAQAPLRGYRRFGVRNLFVVCQVAASLMLLLFTGYMVMGYRHGTTLDPGFDTADLNLLSIDPIRDGYSVKRAQALFSKLPEELSRVRGVRAAALAGGVPFAGLSTNRPDTRVSAETGEAGGRAVRSGVFRERIGANYFATLGVPLVRGHEFERRDELSEPTPGKAAPAIINQTAARELFGSADPIGRRIREEGSVYTVIGVTRDNRSGFLPPKPVATMFLPMTAEDYGPRVTALVRGTAGRETLAALRSELASLHPDLTVFNVHTMRENLDRMNWFIQWSSAVYVVLGLFALLLACVGLGGVTAYAVAQRRKEIGIRMALGARNAQVRRLVLREGIGFVTIGSVLGFGGASAIARGAASVTAQLSSVYQTRVDDPLLVVGAPALLAGLTLLACYLPARRATRIDPVTALREE